MPATVVSSTLGGPLDWPDAAVLSGDAVNVVARLKEESEVPLRSHGSLSLNWALMAAVAVTPGWLRSEVILDNFGVTEENWRDSLDGAVPGFPPAPGGFGSSESPRHVGRAVVALATDRDRARWNQHSMSSADLAREYGFSDLDGTRASHD